MFPAVFSRAVLFVPIIHNAGMVLAWRLGMSHMRLFYFWLAPQLYTKNSYSRWR